MAEGEGLVKDITPTITRREFNKKAVKIARLAGAVAIASTVTGVGGAGGVKLIEKGLTSMEGEGNFNLQKDIKSAEKLVENKSKLVNNPIARANIGMDKGKINEGDFMPTQKAQAEAERIAKELGITPIALDHKTSDRLTQELNTVERIADPETDQEFGVLKLNWDKFKEDQRTLVFLPPYSNTIEMATNNHRLEELARQIGMPTLGIDHPNMGDSDKWTEAQKTALEKDKSYIEIAKAQLRMMKGMGIKDIDLVGQSMGAWAASAIAAQAREFGIKVNNLVIVESPGVVETTTNKLQHDLIFVENKYMSLEQSSPYDPKMRQAGSLDKSFLKRNIDALKFAYKAKTQMDPGSVYGSAMAAKNLPDILKAVMSSQKDLNLTVIHGTKSTISPTGGNKSMITELHQLGFGDRVNHVMFPGEPHTVLENAKRFAAITKSAIGK